MIIKQLKCDQCGKIEEYQIVPNYGASLTDESLEKPAGWITTGEIPTPSKCACCGQQQVWYATSMDDPVVRENKYKKHFCCEECKIEHQNNLPVALGDM
jgi:hypothetical protein